MSLSIADAAAAAGAPPMAGAKRPLPMPSKYVRPQPPAKVLAIPVGKPQAPPPPLPLALSSEARARILAAPKKQHKVALVTDTAEALKRAEEGDAAKRPAPTPVRESASGYVAPPVQSNGTTPATRAMRRAQTANAAMTLAQYNIVKHFVVLDKLLQQATIGAVVAETALDLARSGRF